MGDETKGLSDEERARRMEWMKFIRRAVHRAEEAGAATKRDVALKKVREARALLDEAEKAMFGKRTVL